MLTDERAIAKLVFAALMDYEQWTRKEGTLVRDRIKRAEQIAYRTAQEIMQTDKDQS